MRGQGLEQGWSRTGYTVVHANSTHLHSVTQGQGANCHWSDRPLTPSQLRRALLLIIGLPLNLVLLGFFCWYRAAGGPKRFATQLAGSGAAAALLITLLLLHFRRLVRGRWWGPN